MVDSFLLLFFFVAVTVVVCIFIVRAVLSGSKGDRPVSRRPPPYPGHSGHPTRTHYQNSNDPDPSLPFFMAGAMHQQHQDDGHPHRHHSVDSGGYSSGFSGHDSSPGHSHHSYSSGDHHWVPDVSPSFDSGSSSFDSGSSSSFDSGSSSFDSGSSSSDCGSSSSSSD